LSQAGWMMTITEITGEGGSASPVIGDTVLFATTPVALSFALIARVGGFLDDFREHSQKLLSGKKHGISPERFRRGIVQP
jgi:hypothetical protein